MADKPSLGTLVLAFARAESEQPFATPVTAVTTPPALRSIGYGLFGLLWSVLAVGLNVMLVVVVGLALSGSARLDGGTFLVFAALSPLAGWLLTMVVGGITSQAAFMWIATGRALLPAYRDEPLTFNAGSSRHPVLMVVRQTRASAWWTLVDKLGWTPPWPVLGASSLFYLSLLVVSSGLGGGSLGRAVSYALFVAALAGAGALLVLGVRRVLVPRIRRLVNDDKPRGVVVKRRRKAAPAPVDPTKPQPPKPRRR